MNEKINLVNINETVSQKTHCSFSSYPLLCSRPPDLFTNLLIYIFTCLTNETTSVFRERPRTKISQQHNTKQSRNLRKSERSGGRSSLSTSEEGSSEEGSSSGCGSEESRDMYQCHSSHRNPVPHSDGRQTVWGETLICDILIYFTYMYMHILGFPSQFSW